MLKDILDRLSLKNEDIYFSFPAELTYISLYDKVPKQMVQALVDKDVWLTELKFGRDLIEESDCQVKVVYKEDGSTFLTSVYYPKIIYSLISSACQENKCNLVGLGVNIFNATEIAKQSFTGTSYVVVGFGNNEFEMANVVQDTVIGYARFTSVNEHVLFYARSGEISGRLCEAIVNRDAETLQEHQIFLTGNSVNLRNMNELEKVHLKTRILNPMTVNAGYLKPSVAYDKQYDTVFSYALGALI
ncbi:MAG: hypothetical protein JXR21_01650 [Candidatus Marinimicrobia bacterium]|nr:hypothetical protein [Candidatus Neomarinimicrobiota bacterium]